MTTAINTEVLAAIGALTSTMGFRTVEYMLGLAYPQESYQETADRLRNSGDEDNAELYEALETRW